MIKNHNILAIIPARGGSKRLPRKNILPLADTPLIAWSIRAALDSKYIDKVLVTSDNDEILDIAKSYGSDIIKRPDSLATDTTSSYDAIKHALEHNKEYDYVMLLQPTSPLRTSKHIDEAISFLELKNADAILSVCETDHSPLWSNTLPEDTNMNLFLRDEIKNKRSQDLETYYRLNGAIYLCKIEKLLLEETFFLKDNTFAYVMDKKSSVDIDEKIDFQLAEILIKGEKRE